MGFQIFKDFFCPIDSCVSPGTRGFLRSLFQHCLFLCGYKPSVVSGMGRQRLKEMGERHEKCSLLKRKG